MSEPVIQLSGVSKKFCRSLRRSMIYGASDALRSMAGLSFQGDRLRPDEFWAVNDVSFEVTAGENVGFLGVNGSGKSTLLRLITGIFPPDKGRIALRGNVGALIAVGVGFHPHLTGRENIFLNGTILGMKQREIQDKLEEIIAFAEIGDFIDAPVSTYSSGMTVRLGFAIAIHRSPEIMLVDEVLAVGDLAFQLKCQKKLSEYRQSGGTFIIVSHNMQMIRNTCDRVIWLDKGKIIDEGDAQTVCDNYENELLSRARKDFDARTVKNVLNYDEQVRIETVRFIDGDNNTIQEIASGEPLRIELNYQSERAIDNVIVTATLANSRGVVIFESYSHRECDPISLPAGEGRVEVFIDRLSLKPDVYFLSVMMSENDLMNKLEWHEKSYTITVKSSGQPVNQGLIYVHPAWHFDHEE